MATYAGPAEKLDRLAQDFTCDQVVDPSWERGTLIGYEAAKSPDDHVRFLGKGVDMTVAMIAPDIVDGLPAEVVVAGSIVIDMDDEKRKHARHIWRWLRKNVGAPSTFEWGWGWIVPPMWNSDVDSISMIVVDRAVITTFGCVDR
jgi:hypothetical protein